MKTSASPELLAFLASTNRVKVAELFTITLTTGAQFQWTTADMDIGLFLSTGPVIRYESGTLRSTAGSEVSDIKVFFGCDDDFFLPSGISLQESATKGMFDNATVTIDRAYMQEWGMVVGILPLFTGVVGEVDPTALGVTMTIESRVTWLNKKIPRRLFQPSCPFTLYDVNCRLPKMEYDIQADGEDGSRTTNLLVLKANPVQDFTDYKLGTLQFLNGPAMGTVRVIDHIDDYSDTQFRIVVNVPFDPLPENGDTIRMLRGCDKSILTCRRYGNQANYGGFLFVPKPESIR